MGRPREDLPAAARYRLLRAKASRVRAIERERATIAELAEKYSMAGVARVLGVSREAIRQALVER